MFAKLKAFLASTQLSKIIYFAFAGFAALAMFIVKIPALKSVSNSVPVIAESGIAPDEFRHIANILFYAHTDFWQGPWLNHLTPETLRLGEVSRFPSYFYYYFASFFVRFFDYSHSQYLASVVILRLLSLLFGLLTLFILRRMLKRMQFSPTTINVTLLAFILIGRFSWQSAAVSYDVPAMFLFVWFLDFAVRFLQSRQLWLFIPMAALTLLNSVVKYTFMPFQVAFMALLAIWFLATKGSQGVLEKFKPYAIGSWALAAVISLVLFCERILQNLVVWHQVEPSCDRVQSYEACYTYFGIFRRNTNALESVSSGNAAPLSDPATYMVNWFNNIYQSLFFYRGFGTTTWHVPTFVLLIGFITLVSAVAFVVLGVIRVKKSGVHMFAILVTLIYIGAVFAFNLKTYLNLHVPYATSGRYLLPVLPFVIAYLILGAKAFFASKFSKPLAVRASAIALTALFVLSHNPLTSLLLLRLSTN